MPCKDISEDLELVLDSDDRVIFYALRKGTCSGAVGQPSLLRKWIKNRTADKVSQASVDDLWSTFPTRSKTWRFLYAKHLFAVQRAISALSGTTSATASDYCAVRKIEFTDRGLELSARINIDLLTSEIEACGGCNCGPQDETTPRVSS